MRYLLEFFSTLFPAKKTNKFIKNLKKLQNNLGNFNDLCIQEDYLLALVAELPQDSHQDKMTLLAMGYLVRGINERQQTVKAQFTQTFIHFAATKNQKQFNILFKP